MIQFRLLAGVFRLVLTGEAPELIRFYPCLGGTEPASRAWPVMREVIAAHTDEFMLPLQSRRRPTKSDDPRRSSRAYSISSPPQACATSGC